MCHTDGHRCILPRAPSTALWDLLLQNRRKQRAKLSQQHIFFCSGSNQHAGGFLVGQFLCVHSELDLHAPEVRCSQSERLQQQEEQRCPKGSRAGWLSSAGVALAERFKAVTFSIAPFANMIHPRLCAFWSRIWRASVLPRLANYPLFVS